MVGELVALYLLAGMVVALVFLLWALHAEEDYGPLDFCLLALFYPVLFIRLLWRRKDL